MYWTTATTNTPTNPFPVHLLANRITLPFLLPAYRQKLKWEAPALRTIQCWSDQSDAILQDCFDHVDWDMFRAGSDDDIEAYSDSVTCFIRKCIEDVAPTKIICIYPNQKPWINTVPGVYMTPIEFFLINKNGSLHLSGIKFCDFFYII